MTAADNMPILYRNVLDGMRTDIAKDAFLWAVERPGEDRYCYRAERFAWEVDYLWGAVNTLIDADQWCKFRDRSQPLLDPESRADLVRFMMTRHANWRYGGNVKPAFLDASHEWGNA